MNGDDRAQRRALARELFDEYGRLRNYAALVADALEKKASVDTVRHWKARGIIPSWAVPGVQVLLRRGVDAG